VTGGYYSYVDRKRERWRRRRRRSEAIEGDAGARTRNIQTFMLAICNIIIRPKHQFASSVRHFFRIGRAAQVETEDASERRGWTRVGLGSRIIPAY
jgi:hypothetical protein